MGWVQGTRYPPMSVDDVAWVLEQVHRCNAHGLSFGAYPMHELAAHPQAAELLRQFADHVGAAEFEPLSTTGVPLATREDWRELLAAAATLGTTTVWVAFHGLGIEHDRQVAFTETCLAVQRVHSVGLRAGCNVFLTTSNTPQAERLLGVLQRLEIDQMWWGPVTYYPTARGRRNERLRPAMTWEGAMSRVERHQQRSSRTQASGVNASGGRSPRAPGCAGEPSLCTPRAGAAIYRIKNSYLGTVARHGCCSKSPHGARLGAARQRERP